MPATRLRQGSHPAVSTQELAELFGALARLKNSLCVAVDERLQRQHELPLASFDAMTAIGGSADGCDADHLAASLAVSPDDMDTIIDTLVAGGLAFRRPPHGASRAAPVALTLSGALVLKRAERTVEQVLHAQLDPMLSPAEQGFVQASLRALRVHDVPPAAATLAEPRNPSGAGDSGGLAECASSA